MKVVNTLVNKAAAKVVAEFTTGQLSRSTKVAVVAAAVVYTTVFGMSASAIAGTGLNQTLTTGVANTNTVTNVITYGAYVMGTGLSVLGLLGVKKHVDNPAQDKLGPALGKLGIGGLLFAIPYISDTALDTFGTQGTALDLAKMKQPTL